NRQDQRRRRARRALRRRRRYPHLRADDRSGAAGKSAAVERGYRPRAALRLIRRAPPLCVEPVDELRGGADLLEDLLFEAGALRFEALGFAEDLAGAVFLAA